jgi:short-subunit dehydrogenase
MSFVDYIVWITGASSGIGEALAYAFSHRGARCILSARREEELERVRANCTQPDEHRVVPLDLTDPATLQDATDAVLGDFGLVDLLIHCGGVSQRARAAETDPDVVRRLMEVNFFGTVTLTRQMLPAMLERGQGRIVVVSSLVGKFGAPQRSAYAASKHALHGYFDSLRAEVHDAGLGVTLVCPGYVHTDISRNALTADGTPHDQLDDATARGIPPEACAESIIDAIDRGKDEVYIGGPETYAVYLKRLSPALFNRLIRAVDTT